MEFFYVALVASKEIRRLLLPRAYCFLIQLLDKVLSRSYTSGGLKDVFVRMKIGSNNREPLC
jgi:hypothetical protein